MGISISIFSYNIKLKQNMFADFIKLYKNKNFLAQIFIILSIHKTSLQGHVRSHTKCGPDLFSRFDRQTDRQKDNHSIYRIGFMH